MKDETGPWVLGNIGDEFRLTLIYLFSLLSSSFERTGMSEE